MPQLDRQRSACPRRWWAESNLKEHAVDDAPAPKLEDDGEDAASNVTANHPAHRGSVAGWRLAQQSRRVARAALPTGTYTISRRRVAGSGDRRPAPRCNLAGPVLPSFSHSRRPSDAPSCSSSAEACFVAQGSRRLQGGNVVEKTCDGLTGTAPRTVPSCLLAT